MDKDLTITELQLSQSQIDARCDAIIDIPAESLPTNQQKDGYNCGISALRSKRMVALRLLKFLPKDKKYYSCGIGKRKRSSKRKPKKSTKATSPVDTDIFSSPETDDIDENLVDVKFSDTWDIDWTCTSDQLHAYRDFYYCFLIRQSQGYLFYEPLDNKSFILTDQMKTDHEYNMMKLTESTEHYKKLHLEYFTLKNPAGTDFNNPKAKQITESIVDTWTPNGINYGFIAGEFENYESHSTFVEGLDNTLLPKCKVYNRLPWDYNEWPTYYSFGMWGAMKLFDKVYFSKCMYSNDESGEVCYGARLLSTMCVSPVSKMLIMDKFMKQISFIDGIIVFLLLLSYYYHHLT